MSARLARKTARFFSLLFAALALAPSAAHLLVQQIYRGWARLRFVVGALGSTLVLAIVVRARRREFVPASIAFLCIVAAQVLFWTLTFPANQATANWTVSPDNWQALRAQWEYSHGAAAILNLAAFVALVCAVLARGKAPPAR